MSTKPPLWTDFKSMEAAFDQVAEQLRVLQISIDEMRRELALFTLELRTSKQGLEQ